MKRHQTYFTLLFLASLTWLSIFSYSYYYNISKLKYFTSVLPWLLLMWFGCYCLFKLGIDLLSFNDYPKEIHKLEKVRENIDYYGFMNKYFLSMLYIDCLNSNCCILYMNRIFSMRGKD